MELQVLVASIFALTTFDAWLTSKRIKDYGIEIEINQGVKRMAKWFGPEVASLVMLFGPTLFWTLLCIKLHSYSGLGLLTGFKLRFFYNQLQSLAFEKEAKAIKKEINSRASALPSQSDSANTDPSQTSPSKIKGE